MSHFKMCHELPLGERLDVDAPTIPLAELFLTKAQIVQLNEKDLLDLLALLADHPVGEGNGESINADRIAKLCGADWGLAKTVTLTLDRVVEAVTARTPASSTRRPSRAAPSGSAARSTRPRSPCAGGPAPGSANACPGTSCPRIPGAEPADHQRGGRMSDATPEPRTDDVEQRALPRPRRVIPEGAARPAGGQRHPQERRRRRDLRHPVGLDGGHAVGRQLRPAGDPRGHQPVPALQNATWDFDIQESLGLVDTGDCLTVVGNPAKTFDRAQAEIAQVLEGGAIPVVLGGDHSVTIPAVRAVADVRPGAGLVLIDAHLDTATDVGGEILSNCCPVSPVNDLGFDPRKTVLVGIAGWMNPREELAYCREHGITVLWLEDVWKLGTAAVVERVLEIAGAEDGLYLTVDVDGMDGPPAHRGRARPAPADSPRARCSRSSAVWPPAGCSGWTSQRRLRASSMASGRPTWPRASRSTGWPRTAAA